MLGLFFSAFLALAVYSDFTGTPHMFDEQIGGLCDKSVQMFGPGPYCAKTDWSHLDRFTP